MSFVFLLLYGTMSHTIPIFYVYRLGSYLPHNRNILRIKDFDARGRHLKSGRLPVVSFLSELPATQHDPNSFAVDLSFFTVSVSTSALHIFDFRNVNEHFFFVFHH